MRGVRSMNSRAGMVAVGALVAVAAGCAARPLQQQDAAGGAGGIEPTGMAGASGTGGTPGRGGASGTGGTPGRGGAPGTDGGTPDTSGATDVRPDLSGDAPAIVLTGRRSFVVTSTLSYEAGVTGPPSHTFTTVVDADALKAISGGAGEGTLSSMEKLGLVYRFIGMTRFALSSGCMSSVNYVDLQFHVDPSGVLIGTGVGTLTLVTGDVGRAVLVRSSLSGVPDTQRPTLMPTSGPLTDPLSSVTVSTTEPLPRGMTPMLVSAGESILLAAPPTPEAFVYQFSKPARMLHYARQYQLITDGIADFAGNAATAGIGFMTEAPPPLAPKADSKRSPPPRWAAARCFRAAARP